MSDTLVRFDPMRERHRLERSSGYLVRAAVAATLVGLAGIGASLALFDGGGKRFWCSYLVSATYFLSIALGALFFVILQHLTRAGWSVVLRRLAEAVAAILPALGLAFLPPLAGLQRIYHWAEPGASAHDAVLAAKAPYLDPYFFALRLLAYFIVWSWLAHYYFRRSVEQDRSGDVGLTRKMERLSAPAMVLYAFTVTFAAFDILMSLDPHWYSTIFGVYFFAGSLLGFVALLIVIVFLLQRSRRIRRSVTLEHYHDLGKLLFAFVFFWAYIAFSQYMLIWYGDVPEETQWFLKRQAGQWTGVSVALVLGHFFVPFLALLSRYPKRRPALLVLPALWVLLFHWIDLYWLIGPELNPPGQARVGLLDFSCFLLLAGVSVGAFALRLRAHSLIAERDPRLAESLAFENA